MAETSGETLGGRYRLLGERASFPFGSWWEAEDDQGARTVVLRLHPEVVDPAARTKEAVEVCSRIDTPHLVPWADGGVDAKGQGWLAAPMFGPWSLLEHLTRGEGGLPPVEAAPLIHQVIRAVASGEKAGVLHHALTSELIRLVPLPDGGHGIKVYGYGLSQVLPAYKPLLRKQDGYLGVPDYMSPEMCGGKPSEGSSSDIYALGILMYEAVRGRPPFAPTFASASASATLKRHIFEKPLALHVRYANAQHIKSYETICFKALNKTANRRQVSVAELEQEIEQLITQEMRVPVVPLSAISGRAPTTSRRLRTQVLPSVAAEPAPVASVVVAADLEAQEEQAEQTRSEAAKAAESAAPVATAEAEPEPEVAAQIQVVAGKGSEERNKRTEGTLVFAGLGPAVRELAENAKPGRAPAEAPVEAVAEATVGVAEADEGEGEEEGSTEEEALPASAQHSGGKKGKRKKGRKGSQSSLAAAATVTVPAAKVQAAASQPAVVQPVVAATPKSEAATGESAAAAASDKPEPKEARVRRKDDSTAKNPGATDAAAAVALQVLGDKDAGARKDEQEDWFNKEEEGEAKKPASKAWIFLLLAAAVVAVVIFLLTQDKGAPAQPTAPTGAATGPRYGMADSPKPAQPAPAPATAAPAEVKPVEAKPAEVVPPAPVEAKPAEVVPAPAPVEAKPAEVVPAPAEVKPVEAKPAEVKPAEVKPTAVTQPTQVKPAEVKPTAVTQPTQVKPAEVKPAEVKPTTVTKPAEVKPAEVKPATPTTVTKPAEVKPAEPAATGSPEESFKAQAQHYMKLGIDAFKAEKFGQAADYFRRAQAADPSNKAASAYLRKAQEKLTP